MRGPFLKRVNERLQEPDGMRPWDFVLKRLKKGLKRAPARRAFELDATLQTRLVTLAIQEQRSAREVQADLIEAGLARRDMQNGMVELWQALSAREQQVAALTCLGYTNPQISARLYISAETVKTHLRNILAKFRLHGKAQLKKVLEEWDFSEWEKYIPWPDQAESKKKR
jgi:DNA-binding CsgD family transcriptional regulator